MKYPGMQVTESPCVTICVMDGPTGLCMGCGRTIDEIGRWAMMSPAQRRAIMDALPARLAKAAFPPQEPRVRTGRRRMRDV
jgi:predicted Fe-S protein YdhL (DUF1289 family)